tara:strand:- start:51 stop:398 length:348 start_codon:yes stop_codon:yes gene_type:complete
MKDNLKEVRPWGSFEILLDEPSCKVKKITVNPKSRLSYQYHHKRAERWVCMEGQLTVVIDDQNFILNYGEAIEIPLGSKHRAWNNTNSPVHFIEVQTGTYFGEDDIVRIEDDYTR